jgi:hypothetical protein
MQEGTYLLRILESSKNTGIRAQRRVPALIFIGGEWAGIQGV